jgi:secreted trypsin-like serine protease
MKLETSDGAAVQSRLGVGRWTGAGVVALALVCCAASCGNAPPPADSVGTTTSDIQGGTTDTTHQFAVGIVQYDNTAGTMAYCTGVLLTPNLVATARHCVQSLPPVSDAAPDQIVCSQSIFGTLFPLDSLYVTTATSIDPFGSRLLSVSKIIVPTAANQTLVCGNDIALLILAKPIVLPEYVVPVISPPMTSPSYEPIVTAIGYGIDSPEDEAGITAGIRRIRQNVNLTCIPNDTTFTNCFPTYNGIVESAEFISGDSTCEGDSGSGAFEQSNFDQGKWLAFGVLSRGGVTNGTTCSLPIYTRFDAWGPLIIDAAQQAARAASAEDAGYTLPSWATASGDVAGDLVDATTTTTMMATAGASDSGGCALGVRGRSGAIPGGTPGILVGLGLGIATVRRRRQRAQAPTARP